MSFFLSEEKPRAESQMQHHHGRQADGEFQVLGFVAKALHAHVGTQTAPHKGGEQQRLFRAAAALLRSGMSREALIERLKKEDAENA